MQYLGGKSRIARQLAEAIKNEVSGRKDEDSTKISRRDKNSHEGASCLVSLFCGSCAVESKLTFFKRRICNDKQPYLIEMLKGVQNGYDLPENISEEEYQNIRNNKDTDKVLTGFVGFACSFGGKWFGGYARDRTGQRNYAATGKRSLLKDMSTMQNVEFINKDYRVVELPTGCVVYADPPYANTTGYGKEKFDSTAFWEYSRKVSKEHLMFISEQKAPDDFIPIWETPFRRTLDRNKNNQFVVTEKLFIHKSLLSKLVEPVSEQLKLF